MKPANARAPGACRWLAAGVLASQAVIVPAWATLGEDASSVESDRVRMKAELRTTAIAGYTVHEITAPSGTIVREYISGAGKVFAVSWQGPVLPDFRQTLGRYFADYNSEASSPRAGRRHLTIQKGDLVVRSSGHMRAFYGNAYVPSLLPPNFSVDEIQ